MLLGALYDGLVERERGVLTSNTTSAVNCLCDLGMFCNFSEFQVPPL